MLLDDGGLVIGRFSVSRSIGSDVTEYYSRRGKNPFFSFEQILTNRHGVLHLPCFDRTLFIARKKGQQQSRIHRSRFRLVLSMKNFADDSGVILANEVIIKSKVFPAREDIRKQQVSLHNRFVFLKRQR